MTINMNFKQAGTWWTDLGKVEERQNPDAVVDRPGQLFIEVDLNAGDADIPETEGKLLVDARGNLGVSEGLGVREAVEIGSITGDELLLGGRGHGYD
ncbi:hypothetical protein C1H46_024994 [Malus baccata]|uniref:Uncharacterized protein n=1 Tax=Malus baccata TaxID=106549 RepID=A0A540LT35_MALBA|nr:hypothetical protein C1H46_024994 [Malus baccata]